MRQYTPIAMSLFTILCGVMLWSAPLLAQELIDTQLLLFPIPQASSQGTTPDHDRHESLIRLAEQAFTLEQQGLLQGYAVHHELGALQVNSITPEGLMLLRKTLPINVYTTSDITAAQSRISSRTSSSSPMSPPNPIPPVPAPLFNKTQERSSTPTTTRASLFIGENVVRIYGDTPNVAVTIRLLDGANVLKAQTTITTDNSGSATAQLDATIQSGDLVTMQVSGQNLGQTTVPNLGVEADKQADVVRGEAPTNHYTTFFIQAWRANEWRNYQSELIVDGSGRYELAVGDQWDLRMGDLGSIIASGDHFDFYRNFTVPGYWVNLTQNQVGGIGLPPGATVTTTIYDSVGNILAEGSGQVDSYGALNIWQLTGCQVDGNHINSGQRVVFERDGAPAVTITPPAITLNVVPNTDTLVGRVPGQAKLSSRVWLSSGAVVATDIDTIIADANGNFTADFAGRFDIQAGDWGELTYYDVLDNQALVAIRTPGLLSADIASDAVDLSANPNQSATLTLRNALGAIKGSATVTINEIGSGYASIVDTAGNRIDLVVGDSLQISGAGINDTYILTPLTAVADRAVRTVSGQAQSGATLQIDVGYGTNSTQSITADANGRYTATFDDMSGGDRIRVAQQTGVGRETIVQIYAPQITISPWSTTDTFIYGYATPHQAVAVELIDGTTTTVKARGVSQADQNGFYYIDLATGIQPTDRVTLQSGSLQLQSTMQPISFAINGTTDLLTGQATAQATLNVIMRRSLDGFNWSYFKEIRADSNGNFATDFGGVDFWPGDEFTIWYRSEQGDQQRQITALPNLEVDQSQDRVYVRGEPGTPVKLTLSDAQGSIIRTTIFTPTTPYQWSTSFIGDEAGNRQDLLPGQQIQWENNGRQIVTTIPSLAVALDTNFDRVTGVAPANRTVYAAAFQWQQQWYSTWNGETYISQEVTTDNAGSFAADLHCKANLQSGDYGVIQYLDDAKNYHRAYGFTTAPSITLRQVPTSVRAGELVRVEWEIDDSVHVESTSSSWWQPTLSGIFGSTDPLRGSAGIYQATFAAPNIGPIRVAVYANVDGQRLRTESTIEITSTITLAIQDPVNGTTNQTQPMIRGMSVPSATLTLYDDSAVLTTGKAKADGSFVLQPSALLNNGQHELWIEATVATSTTLESDRLQVTVDSTLVVDPMHIYITNRGQRQRIHDERGFANLGGRIWTRSGDTIAIEIPIRCTDIRQADLLVGGVYAATMVNLAGERWTGTYTPPSSGNYAVALQLNCAGNEQRITLLNGLIDPDGYVHWANADTDLRIPGATVTCYQLQDGEWHLWPGHLYDQQNPQVTANDGYYAFFTEPGEYQIRVEATGFESYESPLLTVVDEPVHHNAPLEAKEKLYLPVVQR